MHYNQFEDVPIWQESRQLIRKIYEVIEKNTKLQRDFSLVDQLKRAGYSILLNIAEGFERASNKEFANFLNIAKASAGEVRAILYVLLDNSYMDQKDFDYMKKYMLDLSAHIANFRKFLLKNQNYKKLH